MDFISPTYGWLSDEDFMNTIRKFMREEPGADYKIVIGTDSQTTTQQTLFVTAFILHRKGNGARLFFRKWKTRPIRDLRSRIYKETEISLNVMEELKQLGISELAADWPVEIHLDVGHQGETRRLIQEVVGWVTAVGYAAIIKPDSYGASTVADRLTKKSDYWEQTENDSSLN